MSKVIGIQEFLHVLLGHMLDVIRGSSLVEIEPGLDPEPILHVFNRTELCAHYFTCITSLMNTCVMCHAFADYYGFTKLAPLELRLMVSNFGTGKMLECISFLAWDICKDVNHIYLRKVVLNYNEFVISFSKLHGDMNALDREYCGIYTISLYGPISTVTYKKKMDEDHACRSIRAINVKYSNSYDFADHIEFDSGSSALHPLIALLSMIPVVTGRSHDVLQHLFATAESFLPEISASYGFNSEYLLEREPEWYEIAKYVCLHFVFDSDLTDSLIRFLEQAMESEIQLTRLIIIDRLVEMTQDSEFLDFMLQFCVAERGERHFIVDNLIPEDYTTDLNITKTMSALNSLEYSVWASANKKFDGIARQYLGYTESWEDRDISWEELDQRYEAWEGGDADDNFG